MSRFSLRDLGSPLTWFSKCYSTFGASGANKEDQSSQAKLNKQVLLHKYKLDELTRKVNEFESQKLACMRSKNAEGAKEAVREKFKLVKKRDKVKEVHDFCLTLLDQLSEAASVKETINTLAEAQSTFGSLNAPMLYKKMDRISNNYGEFKDALSETNSMLSENFNASSHIAGEPSDAELLAELEAIDTDMSASAVLPSVPSASHGSHAVPPTPGASSMLESYRRAGLA